MWQYKLKRPNPIKNSESPFAFLTRSKGFKFAKWSLIIGGAIDVTILGVGYYYYQQFKKSPEFRHQIYSFDPRVIDLYYRANEKYGDGQARKHDCNEWGITKVESYSFADYLIKRKS